MPLIVEDGTLPAGANSFASVADADAYHAARLTAAWTDELAEAQKEAALIRASDWLNRKVMWNGRKASRSQRMAWPRAGVSTQDGEIAPDEIPAEVVEACCELAGFFVEQDYLAPLDRGGDIASLGVDVISIAYNGTGSVPSARARAGASWRWEEDERRTLQARGKDGPRHDQKIRRPRHPAHTAGREL